MSWHDELKRGIRTAEELSAALGLSAEETADIQRVIERFPMMITPYYLSLIDRDDPADPIRKMCVPSGDELEDGGSFDTSGESDNTKLEGLQHKYTQTALLLSTNQCAMYCRHCFRKRLVGLSSDELSRRADEAVDYLRRHKEITNILISGGDALMNPNDILERYLSPISQLDHIDLIRFGSRMPVTLPERIYGDEEFLDMMERYAKRKAIYLITQFNHPRELTPEAEKGVMALRARGVEVKNQTVLMRGVNDDPDTLAELLRGLTRWGVAPYYIFQCRPVTGVRGRFQVPLAEAIRIVDAAKSQQSGLGKCVRFAMSHPRGKIRIIGALEDGQLVFKFHQCKYPEDAARIFTRVVSPTDTWLDDELRPI